jgi:hypothetical protein
LIDVDYVQEMSGPLVAQVAGETLTEIFVSNRLQKSDQHSALL